MATLRKRKTKGGKNVYLVDFYFEGKRIVRSTKTDDLQTAKLILKEIEAKIARKAFSVAEITKKNTIDLARFIGEFLEHSKNHKAPKTYLRDKLSLKNFATVTDNRLLTSINTKIIDDYLNTRIQQVKKSTINIELRHLKAAFGKAVAWKYLAENPFRSIKLLRIPQSAPAFLTKEMLHQLLQNIEEDWLCQIVIFDVNTGLRIGELVNLEWDDIDIERRVICVKQKDHFTTKSKKERNVPMNQDVHMLLSNMERLSAYVFTTEAGRKRDPLFVSKKFKKYIRAVKIGEQFTFHSLRHTFASHLVQKGVSLYIVSKLLGHSSLKTTEIYAHLAPETFQSVVELLEFN